MTLEWDTEGGDVGNHTLVVATDDDVDDVAVTVEEADEPPALPVPPQEEDEPAAFQVSDGSVAPTDPSVDDTIIVNATVTNVGDETGSYTLVVRLGDEEREEEVTLAGGQSEMVTVEETVESPGEVAVELDGESLETVTVQEEEPPDDDDPADDVDEEDDGVEPDDEDDGSLVVIVVAGLAILGVGVGAAFYLGYVRADSTWTPGQFRTSASEGSSAAATAAGGETDTGDVGGTDDDGETDLGDEAVSESVDGSETGPEEGSSDIGEDPADES